ncbi:MAG TPA: TMEM165/GDT1 family protein [Bacillota bacterium]|nr:TMEM165/GDT1 family protein [Bacillota bacterium]
MKSPINWQVFLVAFSTLFIAEMGDKTQLAVFTLAADSKAPLTVFLGASLALAAVTLIGVLFGGAVTRLVPPNYLRLGAGFLFIGIGIYTLWESYVKMVVK